MSSTQSLIETRIFPPSTHSCLPNLRSFVEWNQINATHYVREGGIISSGTIQHTFKLLLYSLGHVGLKVAIFVVNHGENDLVPAVAFSCPSWNGKPL